MINNCGTLFRISNLTQRFWTNYYLPKRVVKIVDKCVFFLIATSLRPSVHCAILRQYFSQKKKTKNPFFTWTLCASNFMLQLPFSTLGTFSIFGQSNFFHIQKLAAGLKRHDTSVARMVTAQQMLLAMLCAILQAMLHYVSDPLLGTVTDSCEYGSLWDE